MASKKYLSLEEAASLLKLKNEELIRLREKGDIRGFADRGTWKFKAEDVEEFSRRRQPDSDPDVAIMDDDDDELSRQATVIRKGRDSSSDSDVRLVMSGLTGSSGELPVLDSTKSDSDVQLVDKHSADSDSDVQLVNPGTLKADSDSDVKLINPKSKLTDSDSDVRLAQSDSDVKLVPLSDSDSDVKLIGQGARDGNASSSEISLYDAPRDTERVDFDVSDSPSAGSALFDDDPGITLPGGDSGIQLSGDSGIQLMGDSGIRLSNDSGIQLQQPADSGILLEGDSGLTLGHGDSSITLSDDSGMKLRGTPSSRKLKGGSSKNLKGRGKPANDLDATAPMLLARDNKDSTDDLESTAPMLLQDDDLDATLDVPLLSDDEDATSASVIMFDEDEDADQSSATVVKKGRKPADAMFDLEDDGDEFAEDDELEVSDEVLGEDDELEDLDAFETDEDEFDESFEAGASRIGFGSPAGKIVAPQEAEWGTGFFLSLLASCFIMLAGAIVSADLLRTTRAGENAVYQGELIDPISGLFK
ncbi:MAG: helix-turn-helix domain-containing protein [Planctomycetes bacterium]|nr:helix-turn-helix domain-containing protein [Planctomycetota bacterium]